jgi:hypothetical protein
MKRQKILGAAVTAGLCTLISAGSPSSAFADEGGLSFWLPGTFGSLSATPATPGWSWATFYIHTDVASAAGAQFPRGGRIDVGISGRGDLVGFGPTYVFATPVLGAQLSVSVLGIAGRNEASAALSLTGPFGNTIALNRTQGLTSVGDVIPQVALKWNRGVNNYMVYGTGDIPIGDYDPNRLANLGIGHGAIDFGGGYTYFDPKSGNEFSAIAGMTYNFKNTYTQYQLDAAGKPSLLKTAKVQFIDDGPGKPVGINMMIGRRPIIAFGNSDGDRQMLEWTTAGSGVRFAGIVHHTDAAREYAYDRPSRIGQLDKAWEEAKAKGWTVVDMKQDWKIVFLDRP